MHSRNCGDIYAGWLICLIVLAYSTGPLVCAKPGTSSAAKAAATTKSPVPTSLKSQSSLSVHDLEQLIAKLNKVLATYKAQPDPVNWDAFWRGFQQTVREMTGKHQEVLTILKSVNGINELGFRLVQSPGLRVYSFVGAPESQQIFLEWKETDVLKPPPKGMRKARTGGSLSVVSTAKFETLACPANVTISDGRLLTQSLERDSKSESLPAVCPTRHRFLVLSGIDRKSGLPWLKGFLLAGGSWVSHPELFSGIPPYLLENVQGKPTFSGSNLVFTSDSSRASLGSPNISDKQETGHSSGYRIVLRFLADHYAFDTKSALDAAMAIALQFSQAIQTGRVDLVKAWLIDPRLASIPGYLGLYNRPSTSPAYRLIAMAPSTNGASRFRLITYEKDDLILDVGKIKSQWAVTGLFIASPDTYAKKLMGQMHELGGPKGGSQSDSARLKATD